MDFDGGVVDKGGRQDPLPPAEPEGIPQPLDPAEVPAVLTVVETVYYQPRGLEPVSVSSGYARRVRSDEQVWIRHVQVPEEWVPIDLGWFAEPGQTVGMMLLTNDERRDVIGFVRPTPDQAAELAARVVEVGVYFGIARDSSGTITRAVEPTLLLPPGESLRGQPADVGRLRLRCRKGKARVTIRLFPG